MEDLPYRWRELVKSSLRAGWKDRSIPEGDSRNSRSVSRVVPSGKLDQ